MSKKKQDAIEVCGFLLYLGMREGHTDSYVEAHNGGGLFIARLLVPIKALWNHNHAFRVKINVRRSTCRTEWGHLVTRKNF